MSGQPAGGDLFSGALAAFQAGDMGRAEQVCRALVAGQPNHDRALFLLGLIAHRAGQHQDAAELMERARRLNPRVAGYYANLADVLIKLGRVDEAIAAANEALRLEPNYPEALLNLGNALLAKGQLDPAIDAYRRAVAASPNRSPPGVLGVDLKARNNLGHALHLGGRVDEGIALLREVTRLHPAAPEFHINLANALKDQGLIEQGIGEYRAAVAAAPDDASIASALLYSLWFDPAMTPRQIFQEHVAWSQRHADPLRDPRPHENDRDPQRKLRLGYLSPYFRHHVSGYLIEPVLAHHDHQRFDLYCYSNTLVPDDFTEKLRGYADMWRDAATLTDEALATRIRDDRIDILIDVACHMDGNRALALARKPAPIQVNYLAYPATSGMSAMDYRITCPLLDPQAPPEADAITNSERLIRIPDTFWCYGPSPTSPAPNDLPAPSSGIFTFGSLNNYGKVNRAVVELWAQVLHAVPNSRLMILIAGGAEGNRTAAAPFEQHGISPDRLKFVDLRPRDQYLALFNQIDLSLDPFPYNGHTTSLDSIWMGVPFVTLAGNTGISRAGGCILQNVGLGELIAPTKARYVELCGELAGDLPRLICLRRELRDWMRRSALVDAPTFTRNLENAYWQMWRDVV